MDEIEIRRIQLEDRPAIQRMAFDVFSKTETIAKELNIQEGSDLEFIYGTAVSKAFCNLVSTVAVDKSTDKVIGMMLCYIEDSAKYSEDLEERANLTGSIKDYYDVFSQVSEDLNYFQRFGVETVFYFTILCVLEEYQGRGIAKSLVKKAACFWKSTGISLARVETTTPASKHIFDSVGFHPVAEKPYCEIFIQGKPFLKEMSKTLSMCVKRLTDL